jgi:hypothetical protein
VLANGGLSVDPSSCIRQAMGNLDIYASIHGYCTCTKRGGFGACNGSVIAVGRREESVRDVGTM